MGTAAPAFAGDGSADGDLPASVIKIEAMKVSVPWEEQPVAFPGWECPDHPYLWYRAVGIPPPVSTEGVQTESDIGGANISRVTHTYDGHVSGWSDGAGEAFSGRYRQTAEVRISAYCTSDPAEDTSRPHRQARRSPATTTSTSRSSPPSSRSPRPGSRPHR
jgi:hypothetical protein